MNDSQNAACLLKNLDEVESLIPESYTVHIYIWNLCLKKGKITILQHSQGWDFLWFFVPISGFWQKRVNLSFALLKREKFSFHSCCKEQHLRAKEQKSKSLSHKEWIALVFEKVKRAISSFCSFKRVMGAIRSCCSFC